MDTEIYLKLYQERIDSGCIVPPEINVLLKQFATTHSQFDMVEWAFHDGVMVWIENKPFSLNSYELSETDKKHIQRLQEELEAIPENIHLFWFYAIKNR